MNSMKQLTIVSAILLALVGCEKKERPAQPSDDTVAKVEVVEKTQETPKVTCDDDALKSRVMTLVGDNILKSAVDSVAEAENAGLLEEVLKAKLSGLSIEVDDIKEQGSECVAKVHVVLSEADVENANKAFAKADLPTLADQAKELGLELVDGHRLVGDLVYQVDGEALSIKSTDNPAIELASSGLAKAIALQVAQQQKASKPANDNKPANTVKVTPIAQPTVRPATQNTTPAQPREREPRENRDSQENREPRTNNGNGSNNNSANNSNNTTPTPRPRAEQPAQPAQPAVSTRPTPKPEPKPEQKPEPKPESKPEPKAESVTHTPVTDNASEITIVESNDTY